MSTANASNGVRQDNYFEKARAEGLSSVSGVVSSSTYHKQEG